MRLKRLVNRITRRRAIGCIFAALLGFCLAASGAFAASESDGAAAEKVGRYREALVYYVDALKSAPAGGEKDFALRRRIIEVAGKIKPTPQVPKEAERFLARGEAAFERAQARGDFERAIGEFQAAANAAPWHAAAYFNLGVAQEKAGKPREAMASFKLYLLAAPGAQDAAAVEKRIYKLEYEAENPQAGARTDNAEHGPLNPLRGTWVWRSQMYDYYFSARVEGTDSLRLTYTRTDVSRADRGFENHGTKSQMFSLRVVGNTVSGTYEYETYWVDGCVLRKAEQVRGVLYTDGRQIDLEYWMSDVPRGDGCVWTSLPSPSKQRIVLRKQ